jgi:hypothetical protein
VRLAQHAFPDHERDGVPLGQAAIARPEDVDQREEGTGRERERMGETRRCRDLALGRVPAAGGEVPEVQVADRRRDGGVIGQPRRPC